MTRTRPAARPRAAALLLALVAGGLGLLGAVPAAALTTPPSAAEPSPTPSPTPSADEASDTLPVAVVVEQISPQPLGPGQDLTVRATLTNDGGATLAQPRVRVHLARTSFISRSALDRWREAGTDADAGAVVLEVDLPAPLAPGASAQVTATVPAAATGLRATASSWGARGLALEVVDAADPSRARQGLVRTFALWFPPQDVTPTAVTVLVPVVGPAPGPDAPSELARLVAPGGRLADVLAATDDAAVSWALDPALLEQTGAVTRVAVDDSGTGGGTAETEGAAEDDATATEAPDAATPTPTPTAGPGAAVADWGRALLAGTTGRDVHLLPWGDADVGALAHAGEQSLLRAAVARSRVVAERVGLAPATTETLAWPGDALPDLATAVAVTADADRALVVGPGELPAPSVLTYTPSGRTTVATANGDATVLVPDERLSAALTTGSVTPTADARQVTGATAAADVLAELAVVTRERPSDGRHLLVTVPRDWSPDPAVASAQLAALAAAPWVRTEPVSALVGIPDTGVDRGTLPARQVAPDEVSGGELDAVAEAVERRGAVAAMAADPSVLLGDAEAERLAPASLAWRSDPEGRSALAAAAEEATAALADTVSVERSAPLNLISTSGGLPVRVANALDQPVTVTVSLAPGDARLVADESVEVTIPAGDVVTVQVPVHAIQSADLDVRVELRTLAGTLVDDTSVLTVRVRADWEGIGTAVLGSLLALGLVAGIIRTVRRGRGRRRAEPNTTSGPDDLSPEQQAAPHEPAHASSRTAPATGPDGTPS